MAATLGLLFPEAELERELRVAGTSLEQLAQDKRPTLVRALAREVIRMQK